MLICFFHHLNFFLTKLNKTIIVLLILLLNQGIKKMRLTRAGEYAIRCIRYLSLKGTGVVVPKQEICAHGEIPSSFLAKIAQDLSKAGLIEIVQGSRGGYRLVKDPKDISLLEVVETMIGRIHLNDCVGKPSNCSVQPRCLAHRIWDQASEQLRSTLAAKDFAQLKQEEFCISHLSPGRE